MKQLVLLYIPLLVMITKYRSMRLILLINSYLASSFTYVAAYSYIGCYKDSLAIQDGIMCFCSNVLPTEAPISNSYCDVSCPNNPTDKCGGIGYDSVYSTNIQDHTLPNGVFSKYSSPQLPNSAEQAHTISTYTIIIYCVIGILVLCFMAFFVYTLKTNQKHSVPLEESKELAITERRSLWSNMRLFVEPLQQCTSKRRKIAVTA
ncbi:hypothetical protein BGW37DRAFT_478291 [Umbelopsis sp. PMI_123]|nr:hypothetical protein BGW37DRAFT_478291 [Umbelopsis sp. PMI_123]